MKIFKNIFNRKREPKKINDYCITFVVDGNLFDEFTVYIFAESKEEAELNFFKVFDGTYYDILSTTLRNK